MNKLIIGIIIAISPVVVMADSCHPATLKIPYATVIDGKEYPAGVCIWYHPEGVKIVSKDDEVLSETLKLVKDADLN